MAEFTLAAESRTVVGKKVRQLRKDGLVPATIYGPKIEPINVQFPYRAIEVMLLKAGGTNVINLVVDDTIYPVLTRDVQRDVIRGDILHIDFFALDMDTKIRANIPIYLINESPLVASRKAVLLPGSSTVTVEMLPRKLMNKIDVDLSVLKNLGDTIYMKDLPIDPDIIVINDPEEMVAKVVQPAAARSAERADALAAAGAEGEGEPQEESV